MCESRGYVFEYEGITDYIFSPCDSCIYAYALFCKTTENIYIYTITYILFYFITSIFFVFVGVFVDAGVC